MSSNREERGDKIYSIILLSTLLLSNHARAAAPVCNGVTDDAPAFQTMLNSGLPVVVPASQSGCMLRSTLVFNASYGNPLYISGSGPKSTLIVGSSSGGLLSMELVGKQ